MFILHSPLFEIFFGYFLVIVYWTAVRYVYNDNNDEYNNYFSSSVV